MDETRYVVKPSYDDDSVEATPNLVANSEEGVEEFMLGYDKLTVC